MEKGMFDLYKNHRSNYVNILLVEDNLADVRLTEEALKDSKLICKMHVVNDGEEAISFLRKEDKYQDVPRPDLIILDLNLPKKSGTEVLDEIKADNDLKAIPVVILTMSSSDEDALRAYNSHANCYITKPINFSQFKKVVNSIEDFWFTIVRLPSN